MLVKCPECGTLVSDKATKCPKCGKSFIKETSAPLEYDGIIKILNKLAQVRSEFPDFWAKLAVYPDNFAYDTIIEVTTKRDGKYKFGDSPESGSDALGQKAKSNAGKLAGVTGSGEFTVQVKEEDLRMMNLVSRFEALDYHDEFTSQNDLAGVTVNDTKMAARIVYDLLVSVFKKKLESVRFVITGNEDDTDNAKYNSAGVFLEGKGYGQGEFAYYKKRETTTPQNATGVDYSNAPVNESGGKGKKYTIWVIAGSVIAALLAMCS